MILTPTEVEALTAKTRSDAQRRALDFMGVPYRVRPDNSLVVLRIHVETPAMFTRPAGREPKLHCEKVQSGEARPLREPQLRPRRPKLRP